MVHVLTKTLHSFFFFFFFLLIFSFSLSAQSCTVHLVQVLCMRRIRVDNGRSLFICNVAGQQINGKMLVGTYSQLVEPLRCAALRCAALRYIAVQSHCKPELVDTGGSPWPPKSPPMRPKHQPRCIPYMRRLTQCSIPHTWLGLDACNGRPSSCGRRELLLHLNLAPNNEPTRRGPPKTESASQTTTPPLPSQ